MPTLRRIVRGARVTLTVAAIAGYAVVSHLVATSPPPAGFGTVLFAVAPLFIALLAVMWRSHRWPAIALAAAGVALLWWRSELLASHLPYVYLLQSLSTSAALMLLFGASLRAGARTVVRPAGRDAARTTAAAGRRPLHAPGDRRLDPFFRSDDRVVAGAVRARAGGGVVVGRQRALHAADLRDVLR